MKKIRKRILQFYEISIEDYNYTIAKQLMEYFLPNWKLRFNDKTYGIICFPLYNKIEVDENLLQNRTDIFLDIFCHGISKALAYEEVGPTIYISEIYTGKKGKYEKAFIEWSKYFNSRIEESFPSFGQKFEE